MSKLDKRKILLYMEIYFLEFIIIKAAITPGTQPHNVNNNTITIEPHPLSKTANGGKKIHKIIWRHDIGENYYFIKINIFFLIITNKLTAN